MISKSKISAPLSLCVFVVLLLLSACSRPAAPAAAPALILPDLSGKNVSLLDFTGQIVLLDFWATWCEPCREELPELLKLQAAYAPRGFTIVGVSMDAGGKRAVRDYVRRNAVSYPILLADGRALEGYRLVGLPTAFLIDDRGRVVKTYLGPKSLAQVGADIDSLLASRFNQ